MRRLLARPILGVLAALVLYGLLVWPTPYQVSYVTNGEGTVIPVRYSRFTGRADMRVQGVWVRFPLLDRGRPAAHKRSMEEDLAAIRARHPAR